MHPIPPKSFVPTMNIEETPSHFFAHSLVVDVFNWSTELPLQDFLSATKDQDEAILALVRIEKGKTFITWVDIHS